MPKDARFTKGSGLVRDLLDTVDQRVEGTSCFVTLEIVRQTLQSQSAQSFAEQSKSQIESLKDFRRMDSEHDKNDRVLPSKGAQRSRTYEMKLNPIPILMIRSENLGFLIGYEYQFEKHGFVDVGMLLMSNHESFIWAEPLIPQITQNNGSPNEHGNQSIFCAGPKCERREITLSSRY
jgi:hypothetical protein